MSKKIVHACSVCEYHSVCPRCQPCVECGAYKDKNRTREIEEEEGE